ncbi:hypothetical protein BC830DRAFT_1128717 [Chytriomyces sp. MP71]|nr:hypothetical protein BC830DRAFT_1128717 [Chytriomyces sp. MP71]
MLPFAKIISTIKIFTSTPARKGGTEELCAHLSIKSREGASSKSERNQNQATAMESPAPHLSSLASPVIPSQSTRIVLPMPNALRLELMGVSHGRASVPLSPSPHFEEAKMRSPLSHESRADVQLSLRTTLNHATPCNSLKQFRLEKRKSYRKQAEKIRRDQLSLCMSEVRQLLPLKYQEPNLSKEATVAAAYACIMEMKGESDRKAKIIRDLEAQLYAEVLVRLHEA